MMKYQRNLMVFTRRSLCAAAMPRFSLRALFRSLALVLTLAMTIQLVPTANAETSNTDPLLRNEHVATDCDSKCGSN